MRLIVLNIDASKDNQLLPKGSPEQSAPLGCLQTPALQPAALPLLPSACMAASWLSKHLNIILPKRHLVILGAFSPPTFCCKVTSGGKGTAVRWLPPLASRDVGMWETAKTATPSQRGGAAWLRGEPNAETGVTVGGSSSLEN